MTVAETKKYLEDIKFLRQYLIRLKRRKASIHLDVSFGGIDYSADRVQNSPKNKLEEAIVKLSDRLERIDKSIAQTIEEIDNRVGCIENLSDGKYKQILYKHYAEDQSLKIISEDMCYTYAYVCNLHQEALRELSGML